VTILPLAADVRPVGAVQRVALGERHRVAIEVHLAVETDHPRGVFDDGADVVFDQQDGHPVRDESVEELEEGVDGLGVHANRRLVQDE